MWEVAACLGANEPGSTSEDAWPADAPNQAAVRAALAAQEGRPRPTFDDPITPDERRKMLALVKGGRRVERGG